MVQETACQEPLAAAGDDSWCEILQVMYAQARCDRTIVGSIATIRAAATSEGRGIAAIKVSAGPCSSLLQCDICNCTFADVHVKW